MATVMVRQIDENDYRALVDSARANGRSLAAEVRDALAERARAQRTRETVEDLRRIREASRSRRTPFADSVELIRAIREE